MTAMRGAPIGIGKPHLIFLFVGLALLAGAAWAYYAMILKPRSWPHAEAVVVSSRVINPGGPTSHTPEIVFRYEAAGGTRQVTVVPSWTTSSYEMVQSHLQPYRPGARVPVAVNPEDPDDIRYDTGNSLSNLLLPGVIGTLGAVFLVIGLVAWRITDRAPPAFAMMSNDALRRSVGTTMRRVALAFFAIGVTISAIGIYMVRSDRAMLREWPEVTATVVDAQVVPSSGSGRTNRPLYDSQVRFRYVVDDVKYENATTYGMATSSEASVRDRVRHYAPGTSHVIRYRPDDPNVIRIDLDDPFTVFFVSGGMVLMGLIFLGFGLMTWKLTR